MRINRAVLAGLVVVVLWATAFVAIRVAAPEMGAIGLSAVRLVVASAALLVAGACARVRLPERRDLGWIFVCGALGMAAYQLLLNWGEERVPAGTASIIVAAAPLVSVAAARVLLAERITRAALVGSAVALAGVGLVCLARSTVALSGWVWIVVAAMAVHGLYHPLQRPLLQRYSSLEVACYATVSGTAMTLPFLPLGWTALTEAGPGAWLAALYLGLAPSALGFVLWAWVVARMPVVRSTSLLYLVSPVAVLIAWVGLGEVPLVSEVFGGLVVIAGVTIASAIPERNVVPLREGRSRDGCGQHF